MARKRILDRTLDCPLTVRIPSDWREDLIVLAEEAEAPSLAYLVRNVLDDYRKSAFRSDSRRIRLEAIREKLREKGFP